MASAPWPGHVCEPHGCDFCSVCMSGQCCGAVRTNTSAQVQQPVVMPQAAVERMADHMSAMTPSQKFAAGMRPRTIQFGTSPQPTLPAPVFYQDTDVSYEVYPETTSRPNQPAEDNPHDELLALPTPTPDSLTEWIHRKKKEQETRSV